MERIFWMHIKLACFCLSIHFIFFDYLSPNYHFKILCLPEKTDRLYFLHPYVSCGENPGNSQHTPKTPRDAEADRLRKRILNITMNPRGLIDIRWKGKNLTTGKHYRIWVNVTEILINAALE